MSTIPGRIAAYETTFITRSDISEDALKGFLEKIKAIISAHGGEVLAVEDWGRRRLAYPIKKESRGTYSYLVYTGNSAVVAEIERNLRIFEDVIRFLTVKLVNEYEASQFKRKPTMNVAHTATAPSLSL